jgi:GH15 family glucan-1,4-alpha-glucosidase
MTSRRSDYLPIEAYGAIGNLRTAALVGSNGSIDWCCFPRFDSKSVFAAILDREKGGFFRVAPAGGSEGSQRYLKETNVLQTTFRAGGGLLKVTDWMPLRGKLDGARSSSGEAEILRLLECEGGEIEVEVEWAPRFDYARAKAGIELHDHGAVASGGEYLMSLGGAPAPLEVVDTGTGPLLRSIFKITPGERVVLRNRWDEVSAAIALGDAMRSLEETAESWRDWVRRGDAARDGGWAGEWKDLVVRSSLALKMMIDNDSGAIVAAPTTSLPEEIGGVRNWDYRYCWIRDAAQTADALFAMGHPKDAKDYVEWAERTARSGGKDELDIQLMYSLDGNYELPEFELEHLEGYRGSRPVRIGNAAAEQLQLDSYGELLQAAYEVVRAGEELNDGIGDFLSHVADAACSSWNKTDHGIWEVRGGKRHFVHSKLMVWVALDRAIQLSNRYGLKGNVERWRESAEHVKRSVLERGYDEEIGAFVQYFGATDLDAANLLISRHELLPPDDPRVQGTIDRTLEQLTENGLVYRYKADDGLPGGEGAFGLCTFWMVDALAISGRLEEANEIFAGMAGRANSVGLFSEEIDPESGEFLGNFPQAYTHVGLINSALYLAHAEGREIPVPSLIGTPEHIAEAEPAR